MDQLPESTRLQELANKYLKGTISPAEQQEFDEWFRSENYENVNVIANNVISAEEHQRLLLDRIHQSVSVKEKIVLWPRIAAAASIFFVISIGVYFLKNQSDEQQEIHYQASNIRPALQHATLTLANGQQIALTKSMIGPIANQGKTYVSINSGTGLTYSISKNNKKIEYNTLTTIRGEQAPYPLQLADGTRVWLDAASTITYPVAFNGNERKVTVKGEAYFEVAHNKAMPFRVISGSQTVEVLGTHFNIMAYDDDKFIKTTLLEGSVKVTSNGSLHFLKPGEQAQVTDNKIKVVNNVDLDDVVAWKNGYFKINENIESIMNKISRWYNVQVIYDYKPDPKIEFGGEISRSKNLGEMLNILQHYGNVHFKVDGRRVTVVK